MCSDPLHDMDNIRYWSDLSDKILDIIDHRDEFTRGDLQGVVEAFVMQYCKPKE